MKMVNTCQSIFTSLPYDSVLSSSLRSVFLTRQVHLMRFVCLKTSGEHQRITWFMAVVKSFGHLVAKKKCEFLL